MAAGLYLKRMDTGAKEKAKGVNQFTKEGYISVISE